jgi:hypothetical protein
MQLFTSLALSTSVCALFMLEIAMALQLLQSSRMFRSLATEQAADVKVEEEAQNTTE